MTPAGCTTAHENMRASVYPWWDTEEHGKHGFPWSGIAATKLFCLAFSWRPSRLGGEFVDQHSPPRRTERQETRQAKFLSRRRSRSQFSTRSGSDGAIFATYPVATAPGTEWSGGRKFWPGKQEFSR